MIIVIQCADRIGLVAAISGTAFAKAAQYYIYAGACGQ
jgi:formyltetrahydrofolate hydrolase